MPARQKVLQQRSTSKAAASSAEVGEDAPHLARLPSEVEPVINSFLLHPPSAPPAFMENLTLKRADAHQRQLAFDSHLSYGPAVSTEAGGWDAAPFGCGFPPSYCETVTSHQTLWESLWKFAVMRARKVRKWDVVVCGRVGPNEN